MRPTLSWLAALIPLIPLFLIPLFIPLRHLHLSTSLMSVPTTAVPNQDSLSMPATIKTPVPLSGSKKSQGSRQRFLSLWSRVRRELEDLMVKHNMPKDAQEWFKNARAPLFPRRLADFCAEPRVQHARRQTQPRCLCNRHS